MPLPSITQGTPILPVFLVTGLSGAGKSSVVSALEDIGFFPIQGIPIELIPKTVTILLSTLPSTAKGIVIGLYASHDMRDFHKQLYSIRGQLQELGVHPIVLFVEASLPTIVQRYSQTRRPHPREIQGSSLEQAIQGEMELRSIREYADIILDTTDHTIHSLRTHIQKEYIHAEEDYKDLFRIQLITFGFKYGIPKDADMIFDVRFLPNPYFIEELRPYTGLDACIQDYVFSHTEALNTYNAILQYLETVLPFYHIGGWRRITIAIGCTGGKHRSVSLAMKLAHNLIQHKYHIDIEHRNIES